MEAIVPIERIERRTFFIRGQKVMLDRDLAELYGVETKVFNQAVKCNLICFPPDFMFRLTFKEFSDLRSQTVTSSWGGQRYLPYVFTEHGVAMFSSVLNSEAAIQVNIQIIRRFISLRAQQESQKYVLNQLKKHEVKLLQHDHKINEVFQVLDDMRTVPETGKKKKIGFTQEG
jgi:hypothetical protein